MHDSQPSAELRWHPLLRQWVGVAAQRQGRPQLPEDWCPFCPGSGQVPGHYDVHLYANDFPALSFENPPFSADGGLLTATGARGACDVVLYSSDHRQLPSELKVEQWEKVIGLWTSRSVELFKQADVQYVCVFENTGVAIGVTMPHPRCGAIQESRCAICLCFREHRGCDWSHHAASARPDLRVPIHSAAGGDGAGFGIVLFRRTWRMFVLPHP